MSGRSSTWSRSSRPTGGLGLDAPTNLLHDASFPLGECDVATRLVADELDLNLATLATTLLIVVVVIIIGRALALTLHAATLGGSTIAVRVVEVAGRGLVVLIGDVGHCLCGLPIRVVPRGSKSVTVGGDAVSSVVPGWSILDTAVDAEAGLRSDLFVGR
jgi:hypothetical protein